ncbi:MAG: ATP synthase F1 subunit epsilon [Firmicutes bacterium]|nr:ATP synthase F1 subunit epsilon [Bacillota bacterium]HAL63916.1 ATP synthase F1 subunit epsilon [Clostridiales bacterium]
MNSFHLCILAADKPFYDGECVSLVIPTDDGSYGVQAHHHNMIAAIISGTVSFQESDGKECEYAAVSQGIMKVENNDVLILVDTAERPDEIDANRAKLDAEEAKEILLQKRSLSEYREAEARLARALTRIKTKGKIK